MKTNLATQLQAASEGTNDIRGIKPPVEIPNEWLWLWITLAVLVLVIAAYFIWRKLRQNKDFAPAVPIIPPHVRAKQRLAEALRLISDPNQFCTEVSQTLRLYLEERFELRAPERTTEEFLIELQKSKHLTLDQKLSLGEFLQSCDLVKFARHEPTEATLRQLHDAALRLVDETQYDPITTAPVTPPALPAIPAAESETANRKS